jgi:hypothetical protein
MPLQWIDKSRIDADHKKRDISRYWAGKAPYSSVEEQEWYTYLLKNGVNS